EPVPAGDPAEVLPGQLVLRGRPRPRARVVGVLEPPVRVGDAVPVQLLDQVEALGIRVGSVHAGRGYVTRSGGLRQMAFLRSAAASGPVSVTVSARSPAPITPAYRLACPTSATTRPGPASRITAGTHSVPSWYHHVSASTPSPAARTSATAASRSGAVASSPPNTASARQPPSPSGSTNPISSPSSRRTPVLVTPEGSDAAPGPGQRSTGPALGDVGGHRGTGREGRVRLGVAEDRADRQHARPAPARRDVCLVVAGRAGAHLDAGLAEADREHGGGGELAAVRLAGVLPRPGRELLGDGAQAGELLGGIGDEPGRAVHHRAAVVHR